MIFLFFLKKVIEAFIFPPGIFIICFYVIGFLCRKNKKVLFISLFFGTLLYLLSLNIVKDLLLYPLESAYKRPPYILNADAIVVLGGGTYISGEPNGETLKRYLAAFYLHKITNLPVIISGSPNVKTVSSQTYFGYLMKAFGLNNGDLYTETSSKDTYQNAYYTHKLCEKLGIRKIVLVTSAYHMPRSYMIFSHYFNVIPYPADYKEDYYKIFSVYSFLPSINNLQNSFKALHEYLGIIYYYLKLNV